MGERRQCARTDPLKGSEHTRPSAPNRQTPGGNLVQVGRNQPLRMADLPSASGRDRCVHGSHQRPGRFREGAVIATDGSNTAARRQPDRVHHHIGAVPRDPVVVLSQRASLLEHDVEHGVGRRCGERSGHSVTRSATRCPTQLSLRERESAGVMVDMVRHRLHGKAAFGADVDRRPVEWAAVAVTVDSWANARTRGRGENDSQTGEIRETWIHRSGYC